MDHEDPHQLVQQCQRSRSPGCLMSWPKNGHISRTEKPMVFWTWYRDDVTGSTGDDIQAERSASGSLFKSPLAWSVWAYCGGHSIGHTARYSCNWYFCSRSKSRSHRNRRRTKGSLELNTQSYDTFWIASNGVEVFLVINIFMAENAAADF